MIEKLELKNFTVFNDLKIDFSSKINVIIGENGTGKTHLLKAAYAVCAGNRILKNKATVSNEDIEAALTSNLLRIFMPIEDKLGKLRRYGVPENAQITGCFTFGRAIAFSFHSNSKTVSIQTNNEYENYSWEPVFIPTKEVLSFMKGFTSLYEKYGLSFDQTYQDICLLLDLPEIRPETLQEKSKWAMEAISEVCGGRFIFYGGGKVTFKTANAEYSANAMAEGFRKVGMLARLLETGAIQPGASGPLFWDEPETNMNPQLMRLLANILLELARNGQQIIIATHDYVLLKWFDLLSNIGNNDQVFYHSLYRDKDSDNIRLQTTDSFSSIDKNAISNTYAELYDEDVKRALK
jgi:AAA15 family ATPase/GTPase